MAAPVLRPLSTGEVLDVSFGLYRSLFSPLIIVAVACRIVPDAIGIYVQQLSGASPLAIFDHWELLLTEVVLGMILTAVGVAASTFVVSGAYLGEPVTANIALARAIGLIGPLILVSIVSSIAIGVGLLVLIVPGVILFSGLVLASVVLVLEQPLGAFGALNRSWELTKGFRFKVFASVFIAVLLFAVPAMIVGVAGTIGSAAGVWSPLISQLLTVVLQIFVVPFLYVVITVLYYDLRVRKEGLDLELLATATQTVG